MGWRRELTAVVIALLVAAAIGSVLILIAGRAPGHVWWLMVSRTLSSRYELGQVLFKATGFTLTGLAVGLALDAGLFNIGAEGQLAAAVLACAVVGAGVPAGTPAIIVIPACMLAAAAAGGAVGALIGALRVWRGAHEVITSIMLNPIVAGIALALGNAFVFRGGSTRGPAIVAGAELPTLPMGGSAVNASIVIAAAAVAAIWWLRARTTWGQAIRAVGRDPATARAVGISVRGVQLATLTASGALAGLAATNVVLGQAHAYENGLGAGAGLLGLVAALLGRLHPVGIAAAAILLGFLSVGGLTVADQVPKELLEVLQGVILLAIAGAVAWVRRRP